MNRPCHCTEFVPGAPWVEGRDCPNCWLWCNDLWGGGRRMWAGIANKTSAPTNNVGRTVLCAKLALAVVDIPGSIRKGWRKCNGGFGSKTGDPRDGMVCGCSEPGPGIFRLGQECGPRCPGFSTTPTEGGHVQGVG